MKTKKTLKEKVSEFYSRISYPIKLGLTTISAIALLNSQQFTHPTRAFAQQQKRIEYLLPIIQDSSDFYPTLREHMIAETGLEINKFPSTPITVYIDPEFQTTAPEVRTKLISAADKINSKYPGLVSIVSDTLTSKVHIMHKDNSFAEFQRIYDENENIERIIVSHNSNADMNFTSLFYRAVLNLSLSLDVNDIKEDGSLSSIQEKIINAYLRFPNRTSMLQFQSTLADTLKPVAVLTAPDSVYVDQEFTLDSSGSSDNDKIEKRYWQFKESFNENSVFKPDSSTTTIEDKLTISSPDTGSYNIALVVTDPTKNSSSIVTKRIFIKKNLPPILNAIGNKEIAENDTLKLIITASDPENDSLTYSVLNKPDSSLFQQNENQATFLWVPSYSTVETPSTEKDFPVTFKVTDSFNNSSEETIIIKVLDKIQNYIVNVKLIDPLLNEGVYGLKVSLKGKSAFTDSTGTATLEYLAQRFTDTLKVDRTSEYAGIGNPDFPYIVSVSSDTTFEEALFPLVPLDSTVYSDLLTFIRAMNNDGNNIITIWQNLPIQVYKGNPPDQKFDDARVNAQANWENKTFIWKGRAITPPNYFEDVDSDPTTGMRIVYDTQFSSAAVDWEGSFGGEKGHTLDGTPRKAVIHINPGQGIRPLDNLTKLYEHEIHHVLHDTGLESNDRNHASNPTIDVHVSKDDSIFTTLMHKLTEFYKAKSKFPDLRIYQ